MKKTVSISDLINSVLIMADNFSLIQLDFVFDDCYFRNNQDMNKRDEETDRRWTQSEYTCKY